MSATSPNPKRPITLGGLNLPREPRTAVRDHAELRSPYGKWRLPRPGASKNNERALPLSLGAAHLTADVRLGRLQTIRLCCVPVVTKKLVWSNGCRIIE